MAVSERRRGCLQFSLRTILVVMTLSAIACGTLFAAPMYVAMPIVATCFLMITPTILIVSVIYARGYLRTFAVGALIPLGVLFQGYTPYLLYALMEPDFGDDSILTRLIVAGCVGGALILLSIHGGLAMFVRWLVERCQDSREESEPEVPQVESPFDAETAAE